MSSLVKSSRAPDAADWVGVDIARRAVVGVRVAVAVTVDAVVGRAVCKGVVVNTFVGCSVCALGAAVCGAIGVWLMERLPDGGTAPLADF